MNDTPLERARLAEIKEKITRLNETIEFYRWLLEKPCPKNLRQQIEDRIAWRETLIVQLESELQEVERDRPKQSVADAHGQAPQTAV